MTQGYWFKIFLGAFAIFVVGMGVVQAVEKGKNTIEQIAHSDASITLPLLSKPFMLEGRDLGKLKSLRIDRSAPKAISGFHLAIELDDPAALESLATCDLSLDDFENIDFESTGFVCVSPFDMQEQGMVPFGTITFRPSGEVHVLNVPASIVEDLRREMGNGAAELDGVGAEINAAMAEVANELGHDKLQVKVNGRNVVDIQGGEQGGHLIIRDPATGKAIVEARGGPDGGVLKIDAGEGATTVTAPKAPGAPDTP